MFRGINGTRPSASVFSSLRLRRVTLTQLAIGIMFTLFMSVVQAEVPDRGKAGAAISSQESKSDKLKVLLPDVKEGVEGEKEWGRQQPVDEAKMIDQDPHGYLLKDKGLVEVDMGFIHAFLASLSVIIVSELGDKTFFIAAIMAMRYSRVTVFAGAMAALGLMTVLSALLGYATTVIPRWLTYYVSSGLFALFGLKMLKEGYSMDADEGQEELEEVQADLRKKDEELQSQPSGDVEAATFRMPGRRILYSCFSRIFLQSLTLTFLAEWGDRSQIATIILAARDEVIGVIIGGTLGHALCTSLAVMGGRFIAQRISIKTVHLIGGVVFLIFAVSAFFIDPDE